MPRRLLLGGLLAVVVFALSGSGRAESKKAVIGRKIDGFTLKDSAGKEWSLDQHKDIKAMVILFLGTECPVNNAYLPRLRELNQKYQAAGVVFVAINANQQDTPKRIAEHVQQHHLPFPVLKDGGNVVADRFGAEKTPEAFVLDAGRVIRYRGRIDDQFGPGYKRPRPTRNDLTEALDEVLAGKTVTRPETETAGCFIARLNKPKADATVSYSRHVAPLLQKYCQDCHRPGEIGPMSLLSYDDAAAWSETIRQVIEERRMPPWHADPKHGTFANNRRLPDGDRDTLLKWIEQGCAQGDATELPPARKFADGWSIGKPDLVLTAPQEFTVPAKTPPGGVPYKYFMVPSNFTVDRWVQAAEVRPGSREVVHHILVYVRERGQERGRRRDAPDGIGDGMLVAYAPGDQPFFFPAGTAKRIPKDSMFVFQVHYTPDGTQRKDRSSLALIFAKEPPQHAARTRSIAQPRFAIPPGNSQYKVTAATTFPRDALLLNLFPHMHLRGKSFEYRAVYPDGRSEILLSVPRYDFGWQTIYRLTKPLPVPAGTKIECTACFDNSTDNPNNPDPTKTVRWGDQTWEEMMIGFVDYCFTGQDDDGQKHKASRGR